MLKIHLTVAAPGFWRLVRQLISVRLLDFYSAKFTIHGIQALQNSLLFFFARQNETEKSTYSIVEQIQRPNTVLV